MRLPDTCKMSIPSSIQVKLHVASLGLERIKCHRVQSERGKSWYVDVRTCCLNWVIKKNFGTSDELSSPARPLISDLRGHLLPSSSCASITTLLRRNSGKNEKSLMKKKPRDAVFWRVQRGLKWVPGTCWLIICLYRDTDSSVEAKPILVGGAFLMIPFISLFSLR